MGSYNVHLMNGGANPEAGESIEPTGCDVDGIMPPDAPPVGSGDGSNAEIVRNSVTVLI